MDEKKPKRVKKHICAGLLAHVDAGKTTLSEAMLYLSGNIRKLGRVDNRDAFLDTFELERERGITIFSKQAVLAIEDTELILLDTPGHVDFSAEMERTLQVLDIAILVISGADGVQGHTETLWKLLARYHVPTVLFINKMDQDGTNAEAIMEDVRRRLDSNCVVFGNCGEIYTETDEFFENAAMCDESMLEEYLETGSVAKEDITKLIGKRKIFPCYFGSALKLQGVEEFLQEFLKYTPLPTYAEEFGAKVFKIARDDQGNRLTYLKVTGGTLRVKDTLTGRTDSKKENLQPNIWEEKINQIRIYSGAKYESVNEAAAGVVCAVTGLTQTHPGKGLGIEKDSEMPILEPVLNYQIQLPEDCNVHEMLLKLKQLEEEEPLLHIIWNEKLGEIHAQLMGEVQIEILKRLIWERYKVRVEFGVGNIVYKETIQEPVEGVGHFEPLRHYAEVHLLLEPGEKGSGIVLNTTVSEDELDRNWQRLILTHLEEKEHVGVLTGAPITDMKIILTSGRAHLKHTEGGDFRQATYRAVRQGLKKAKSILLEPYYSYKLEVPAEYVGRAMSDLQRMKGSFGQPQLEGEMSVLEGEVPVIEMQDYQSEVISYTKGRGRLNCTLAGYRSCHNTEEVIAQIGYDSERDLDNPTGSIFCAHGAGFVVPWYQVEEYMHLDSDRKDVFEDPEPVYTSAAVRRASTYMEMTAEDERELEAMVEASRRKLEQAQTRKKYSYTKKRKDEFTASSSDYTGRTASRKKENEKQYLLVDGYNIIFAWDDLKELAEDNIDGARGRLMDILSNYQGMKKCEVILVFDAYKVQGFQGEIQKYHNIYVVYTKEAETADQYIEKTAHEIGRKYDVTVATSDGTEQVIIRGQGCYLLSAQELRTEIELTKQEMKEVYLSKTKKDRNYLFDYLDEEIADQMEKIRLGMQGERT